MPRRGEMGRETSAKSPRIFTLGAFDVVAEKTPSQLIDAVTR
jgi:hypothetical protein